MKYDHIHNLLRSLVQLDVDALHTYDRVIEHIDNQDLHHSILHLRSDHERHITDINDAIRRYGGVPLEATRDIKGVFQEGLTALKSMGGQQSALKALHSNEKKINDKYGEALAEENLPLDIRALLERHYGDESRHTQFIETTIREVDTDFSTGRYTDEVQHVRDPSPPFSSPL